MFVSVNNYSACVCYSESAWIILNVKVILMKKIVIFIPGKYIKVYWIDTVDGREKYTLCYSFQRGGPLIFGLLTG